VSGLIEKEALKQVNPDTILTATDFPTRLGQAYTYWAEQHPNQKEEISIIEPKSIRIFTPKTIASEIARKTPFGLRQIDFYKNLSKNLGDKSGEKVIQDLIHCWDSRK
jgi:hypothetical protein